MKDYSDVNHTRMTYNNNASSYADKFEAYAPYLKIMSRFQAAYLQDNDVILDAGCGPGNNCQLLLSLNNSYRVTGIDIAPAMLEKARNRCPSSTFVEGDIRNMYDEFGSIHYDQISDHYDAVVASFSIVHLTNEDTRKTIHQLARALNTKGYLYLSFMEGKTPGAETTSFTTEKLFYNYFDRHWIIELLKQHSISCLELLTQEYPEADGSTTQDIFIFGQKQQEVTDPTP